MMKVFDIILGFIEIPIGMILFICIAVFATVLWLPYFVWLIFSKIFLSNLDNDDSIIALIFICYDLAVNCLIVPFEIIKLAIKK